jgi:phosphate-selective porin
LDPELEQRGLTKGARLLYEFDGGRLRLALSGATLNLDGEMLDGLLSGTVDIDYWIASAQYNRGPLSLTMEYMNEPIEYDGFSGLMAVGNTTVDGYYLQGNYRLSPDWEVLARYEEGHFDKHDKDGSDVMVPLTVPYNHYAKMWTVGLLWEPTENLLMRAEYSRVDGTMFLSNLENPNLMATERTWNMFALLISYSF